jgi:biopolymer transport protein ExbB/TolQ
MSNAQTLPNRRQQSPVAVFLVGLPLAGLILGLIHLGPFRTSPYRRYFIHPVECVEVVLFCCALTALGGKLWRYGRERRACRTKLLPAWDGQLLPVSEAAPLLDGLGKLPRRLQDTYTVQRAAAVLDFLRARGSADGLDDQLRALTDNDALALEGSYALTRFITWAIPILGFLGTVLGITGAISGVTPEVLEKSLSTVTDGLALAFDTTALGLALTMVTMFCSFVVERAEQNLLETVDRIAEKELAHRFERTGGDGGDYIAFARQQTQILLKAVEHLVQRQAEIWAKTFDKTVQQQTRAAEQQQAQLTQGLKAALDTTLQEHQRRLSTMEKQALDQGAGLMERIAALAGAIRDTGREQRDALAKVTAGLSGPLEVLAEVQEGEKQLIRLQEVLQQNLSTLAGAGAFEQAVNSLTAAIHLLTARAGPLTHPLSPGGRGQGEGAGAGPRGPALHDESAVVRHSVAGNAATPSTATEWRPTAPGKGAA